MHNGWSNAEIVSSNVNLIELACNRNQYFEHGHEISASVPSRDVFVLSRNVYCSKKVVWLTFITVIPLSTSVSTGNSSALPKVVLCAQSCGKEAEVLACNSAKFGHLDHYFEALIESDEVFRSCRLVPTLRNLR